MKTSPSEFLNLQEVAAYLKIAKSTLYKLSQKGDLPSVKIGKQLRFRKSSIELWLAGREARLKSPAPQRAKAASQPVFSKPILLVDDDTAVLRSVSGLLSRYGYTVETAQSGEEAVRKAAEREFALLITDVRMPGMDGIETLQRIRQINDKCKRRPAPEVVLTGYLDTKAEEAAERLGIHDYLYKPFAIAEFLSVVKDKLQSSSN